MKKLIFLFAMVFAVSMAIGQNEAYIDQIGATGSSINVSQKGDGNLLEGPASVLDALNVSHAAVRQVGGGTGWDSGVGGEVPDSNPNVFDFAQWGNNNYGWVDQEGNIYHAVMDWTQLGNRNSMMLEQYSKFNSLASVGLQEGNDNKLGGLTGAACTSSSIVLTDINSAIPAHQSDMHGSAHLDFTQVGNRNAVGLFQDNYCCETRAVINQTGNDNEAALFQCNPSGVDAPGKNLLSVTQTGNFYDVVCFQKNNTGAGNNFASVQ